MARHEVETAFKINAKLGSSYASVMKQVGTLMKDVANQTKALSQQAANVNGFNKQTEIIKKTSTALEEEKKKLKSLEDQYNSAGGKNETLAGKIEKSKEKIAGYNAKIEEARQKQAQYNQKLQESGVDVTKLDGDVKQLEEDMQGLSEGTEEATQSFDAMATMMAAQTIFNGLKKITDAMKECTEAYGEFEKGMSYVKALTGSSGEALDSLSDKAKTLGLTTVFTAAEVTDAFGNMSLAGWSTDEMLQGIDSTLNLAAASNIEIADATRIVTDNLTAFGLTAKDTTRFVDIMASAMSNSNTDTTQLGEAYKSVAASSTTLGQSVEETSALLMIMANSGIKGGEAGTGLNTIMTRLATNTSNCADKISQYTSVYDESTHKFRGMSTILTELSEHWGDLDNDTQNSIAKSIAGQRQLNKFLVLMNGFSQSAKDSGKSYGDFLNILNDSSGSGAQMAETMLDNLEGKLTLMNDAITGLQMSIGEALAPVLGPVVEKVTELATAVSKFVDENPELVAGLGTTIALFTALEGAIVIATMAQVAFDKVLSTSPIFKIGSVIAGAISLIVGLASALGSCTGYAEETVSELMSATQEAQEAVSETLEANNESVEKAYATAELAGGYVDVLKELKDEGLESAEAQERYSKTIDKLKEIYPEIADQLSDNTREIDSNIEAIDKHIDATKREAEAQAKYAAQLAYQEEQTAAIQDRINAEIEEIRYQKKIDDLQEEINAKKSQVGNVGGQYSQYVNDATGLSELNTQLAEYQGKLKGAKEAQELASEAETEAGEKIEILKDELEDYNDIIDTETGELKGNTSMVYANADAVEEATDTITESDKEQLSSLDSIISKMDEVTQAYEEAYDAALSSYQSRFGLFDKWTREAEDGTDAWANYTVEKANEALDTQKGYWEDYSNNLKTITDYTATLPEQEQEKMATLIGYVSDGSEEAAGLAASIAEALASGDEAQIQAVLQLAETQQTINEKQDEIADNVAKWSSDIETEMQNLQSEMVVLVGDMDLGTEASSSAESTLQSYYDKIGEWETKITSRMSTLISNVKQSIATATSSLDSGDPTNMQEYLKSIRGYAVGTESAEKGFALVGEKGPELVYFNGGEQVVTAEQTREMASINYNPFPSSEGSSDNGSYNINVAPVYNISANNAEGVQNALEQNTESIRSLIVQTINNINADNRRRAYA